MVLTLLRVTFEPDLLTLRPARSPHRRGLVVVDLDELRQADDLRPEPHAGLHPEQLDLPALRPGPAQELEQRREARAADVGDPAEVDEQPPGSFLGGHQGQLGAELPGQHRALQIPRADLDHRDVLDHAQPEVLEIGARYRSLLSGFSPPASGTRCPPRRQRAARGLRSRFGERALARRRRLEVDQLGRGRQLPSLQRISLRAIGKPSQV